MLHKNWGLSVQATVANSDVANRTRIKAEKNLEQILEFKDYSKKVWKRLF